MEIDDDGIKREAAESGSRMLVCCHVQALYVRVLSDNALHHALLLALLLQLHLCCSLV